MWALLESCKKETLSELLYFVIVQVIELNGKQQTKDLSVVGLMLVAQYLIANKDKFGLDLVPIFFRVIKRFAASQSLDKVILPFVRVMSLTIQYPDVYLQRKCAAIACACAARIALNCQNCSCRWAPPLQQSRGGAVVRPVAPQSLNARQRMSPAPWSWLQAPAHP